jgi:hypothetical protein
MTKTHKNGRAAAVTGFLTASALVLLVLVAAATAAPQVAPVIIDPPTITGTARVGEALTAQNGTWQNSPTEYRYRWLRCNRGGNSCVLLAADGKTYRVGQVDVGNTIRVRVTAVNANGERTSVLESVGIPAKTPAENAARALDLPRTGGVTAPAWSGRLSCGVVDAQDDARQQHHFRTYRVRTLICADVVGATGKSYGVRTADLGFRLRVEVTAHKDARSGTATSAATGIVVPTAPITNHRPTISIISIRFTGARVYARFRICDDTPGTWRFS